MHSKNIYITSLVITFLLSAIIYTTPSISYAESNTAQKALENVKESVEMLIEAKDQNEANELTLRIETFKKVIDFSIAEAKDLKIKLLAMDEELPTSTVFWRESAINRLNDAINYYDDEKENIEKMEDISVEDIKSIAGQFKKWREETYIPLQNEINDFFFIEQEQNAIETANNRLKKVGDDITKLKKAKIKNISKLEEMFKKAEKTLKESAEFHNKAEKMFGNQYIYPILYTNQNATSSTSTVVEKITQSATSTPATSTSQYSTSSIKDFGKQSFEKIKDAYKIFIEMSNLVRKLL